MKKITLLALILTLVTATGIFASRTAHAVAPAAASMKIINDTDNDVQIHTGSGFVEINKGSSTSITCEAGKVISLADKGKKKGELFTVDESMCGKVVKLSKYL